MSVSTAIIALGCLIFLSHIFNALFERTKIPSVIFLIGIGIFTGPVIMNWVEPKFLGNFGNVFTTVTFIVILFDSGTELNVYAIRKSIGRATALTVTCFITTLVISSLVIFLLTDLDIMSCIFIGSVIGGTSVAIVIPVVRQLKLREKSTTILSLESALSSVLSLIISLAIFENMQSGEMSIVQILINMILSFVAASLFGATLGIAWAVFQHRILKDAKNMMFASFAFAFIIYGVCDQLNLNGGTAVLVYGITLGNINYFSRNKILKKFTLGEKLILNEKHRTFFSEIGFVLQTYFFVYVGINLKFSDINLFIVSMIVTALVFIGRQFITKFIISKQTSVFEREIISIMTPKGLVAAVLASLPLQYGLANGDEIQGIVYSIVFISILLCSFLAANIKRQKEKLEKNEY
ncbi:MAG: cation:proton antiporter [Prevotellaceae bacterium]|jgi:NhaP-type Na+/H+ or K+/H+ antiporter|nr:cation:proton antiporter [Prevotellaceae bacterium]